MLDSLTFAQVQHAALELALAVSLLKGGPGSGCHGDNCGRPVGSGSAYQLYSPNIAENMSFAQAEQALRSDDQARFGEINKDIDQALGMHSAARNAIGDWSDGAENSIFNEIENPHSYEELKYSAAIKGDLANQKAVIPFLVGEGADSLYRFDMGGSLEHIRETLSKEGVNFRTLIPHGDGAHVIVFDPGTQMHGTIERMAETHGLEVKQYPGHGEFIGGDTRAQGRQAYAAIISQYEGTHHTSYLRARKGDTDLSSKDTISKDSPGLSDVHVNRPLGDDDEDKPKEKPYGEDEIDLDKGGEGSGCHGPNCGRPRRNSLADRQYENDQRLNDPFLNPEDAAKYGTPTFYHGTADVAKDAILMNGLVPAGGKGADAWAREHDPQLAYMLGDRPASVYMTPSLMTATQYAQYATAVHPGSHGVVFEIHPPKSALSKFKPDEQDSRAYRYEGKISPKWIKKVDNVPESFNSSRYTIYKTDPTVFYIVIICCGTADCIQKADEDDVQWITVNGTHIPIGGRESSKSELAKANYKPSTAAKQAIADDSEKELAEALGMERTGNNKPFDLTKGKVAVEVKTLISNGNSKITMHPESRQRKLDYAKKNKMRAYTVVVDKQGGPSNFYFSAGVGSFRIGAMRPVSSTEELKRLLR